MSWTPDDIAISDWGHLRVRVGGKDVTFFRDALTIVGGWQDTDPYSSNNASLLFPQITEFDDIDGDAEFDWLFATEDGLLGSNVFLDRVNDGVVVANLFEGLIDRIEVASDAVTATCSGNFSGRKALQMHQPPIIRKTRDLGVVIDDESGSLESSHFDLLPLGGLVLDIPDQSRGSRDMTELGFIDECLGKAIRPNGDSLTILQVPGEKKTYRQQWRSMATVDATVSAGAHGVKFSLSKDITDDVNRVYGEWVTPSLERCRGAVYPQLRTGDDAVVPDYPNGDGRAFGLGDSNSDTDSGSGIRVMCRQLVICNLLDAVDSVRSDVFDDDILEAVEELQRRAGRVVTGDMTPALWDILYAHGYEQQSFRGAHFRPIAADTRTERLLYGADGTVYDLNPDADHRVQRVEQFVSYGEGMRSKRVRRNARALIARSGGWAGTVTLTTDPAEMSRFEIRAGMTLAARWLKGSGSSGMKLYISSVQVDWASGAQSVTLAVSTTARHYMDLAARRERNRAARQDPGAHWRHQLRRSAQTSDAISGWEGESGAGIVDDAELVAGRWNVIRVIACELGTMGDLRLFTDDPTIFYCALFADEVHPNVLDNRIGDPSVWVNEDDQVDVFMENTDWLVEDERLMVEYWGTPDQPCGLWPKPYLNRNGERTSWPINGKQIDVSTFTFASRTNFLYLAVWTPNPTTIAGRMRISLNEGV